LAVDFLCKRATWANSVGARHANEIESCNDRKITSEIDSFNDRKSMANQKEAVDENVEETSQGQLTRIRFNPERKLKKIVCSGRIKSMQIDVIS
jgi:hypothetical protein